MKQFLIVLCLAAAMPGQSAHAAPGFPWFRLRPKPALLEQPSSPPAGAINQNRVPYHGAGAHSASGRLYFKDGYDRFRVQPRRHSEPVAVTLARDSASRAPNSTPPNRH